MLALILAFSPGEKKSPWHVLDFSDGGPANPVARIFKQLANDFSFSLMRRPG
jgi:hypothetical protein